MQKRAQVLFFLLLAARYATAQREFEFGQLGGNCHFQYVCYSANGNYSGIKRPFIFVLSKGGESAMETFNRDSLHLVPQFAHYFFVFVPFSGDTSTSNLSCLHALSSLLTFNYAHGFNNLFLQANDQNITVTQIKNSRLDAVFKHIRLSDGMATKNNTESAVNDFAETFVADDETEEETDEETTADSPGTYVAVKQRKTYFGPATAFNYTLSGKVRDRQTGEALPFATIQVKGSNTGVSTNADGYFTLPKVPTDTSTLVVQYIGYQKTFVFLTPSNPKTHLVIDIQPETQSLKEVVITAARQDVVLSARTEVSTVKMTPRKLEQLPNIGEKDILRSFQLMPGVSASNESSSGLYVRGGTPDQNLIVYDGFTVYQVDHLYGFFSAFNANALKDVQLYKGGFESRFGGRLSSVTEISGKDGNQKKFNMGADLSLLSMNAFMEIPVGKKFSSIIAFRRSYKGPLYNKIFKKFNTGNTSVSQGMNGRFSQQTQITSYFYDLNAKFTYRPTQKDILSVSIFNGTDKLDNSSNGQSPMGGAGTGFGISITDLTRYGNVGSSLKWSRKWASKLYGNTVLSYSNYYSNRDRSQERTSTDSNGETTTNKNGILENNNLRDYSFKSDYQWDLLDNMQLQFGAFATYYNIKYTYAQNDTLTILDRHDQASVSGVYLQAKTTFFHHRLQVLPGIRTSYFSGTSSWYYEPRASASLLITDQLTLKAATGKYYQFANRITREDILSGSRDFWIMADGNKVPVSSAIHYVAGLSYETNNYLFSAEGYYKTLQGLTEYSLRFNASPMGIDYNENFFNGSGFAKGIEFLVQKKSGNFNGWVSYTLGQAHNKFTIYSDTYYPAAQDVTHEFKIVGLYHYKRWDFSLTWIYATGRPYTAPSGAYSITLLDGSQQDYFTVTDKNSLRLPDYHRCDFSVNYRLMAGERKKHDIGYIGFSIFNVYNHRNVWYKQYTISDGQIIETDVNYLGFTPNLTLSLKIR